MTKIERSDLSAVLFRKVFLQQVESCIASKFEAKFKIVICSLYFRCYMLVRIADDL